MHALELQSASSTRVIVDGKAATAHPEPVFTIPDAAGDALGEAVLVGVCPITRHVTMVAVVGHVMPSSIAVVVGYESPTYAPSSYWNATSVISASVTVMADWLEGWVSDDASL